MIRIVESKFITSAVNTRGYPDIDLPEFAFVGRSNVGKSSMINTLTNRKLLAKIANTPGKTRLINFFEIRYLEDISLTPPPTPPHSQALMGGKAPPVKNERGGVGGGNFTLVDLPGYGYAKVSKSERGDWKKMINEYFQNRKQLTGAVVLVDIRHNPDPKDAVMIRMLSELKIDFIVVATKCDKIPKSKIPAQLKLLRNGLSLQDENIFEFSSTKKVGIEKVLDWITQKQLIVNS